MTTNLIILRHGNTFNQGEAPRRVGARTDLPLVESGQAQAKRAAKWLKAQNIQFDALLCGPLKRHTEMADIIIQSLALKSQPTIHPDLTEIDYGPDENKTEPEVIARIGEDAINNWNTHATVPNGWHINPDAFIQTWHTLAETYANQTILVVTSNGTARFALNLLAHQTEENLKLGTGCIGWLTKENAQNWTLKHWNIKPE